MIKKLLGIIVLGLLLSGNAYAENLESIFKKGISKKEMCKLTKNRKVLKGTVLPGAAYCHKAFQSNFIYLPEYKTEIIPPLDFYNVDKVHPKVYFIFENVTEPMKCKFSEICNYGDGILEAIAYSKEEALVIADPKFAIANPEYVKIYEAKIKKEEDKKQRAEAKASGDLTFTIKDKKEQCTAIGFAPATEKFADCVLRLVELDVKSQQATQIALAQSQGNQQIADQLKKQRSDQSSQYFLDLSQKLLNPQSTVSAPSTSTCTISGGVYKNISCW